MSSLSKRLLPQTTPPPTLQHAFADAENIRRTTDTPRKARPREIVDTSASRRRHNAADTNGYRRKRSALSVVVRIPDVPRNCQNRLRALRGLIRLEVARLKL